MNMKRIVLFFLTIMFASIAFAEATWIDVRSAEEYGEDHINGDINISYEQIVPQVKKLFPDRNTELHLYCKSGRRAGIAMSKLQAAGYTNITNAGGIDDARVERKIHK